MIIATLAMYLILAAIMLAVIVAVITFLADMKFYYKQEYNKIRGGTDHERRDN